MTTYLGKSCSFGLPRVPFVNCRQFMYLVISLLVLRAGCGIWLYQFLIIAYLFTLKCLKIDLKIDLSKTVIMPVISFITTERQGSVWSIWFKWFCHIHARMRCWARPPRQKSKSMTKVVCTLLVSVCMIWRIRKTNVIGQRVPRWS